MARAHCVMFTFLDGFGLLDHFLDDAVDRGLFISVGMFDIRTVAEMRHAMSSGQRAGRRR